MARQTQRTSSEMSSSGSAITRASAHALSYYNGSSGTPLYTNISTDIDSDRFMQSGQRAGGPYLCSLPTRDYPVKTENFAYPLPFEVIEENVGKILGNSGIAYRQIAIIGRRSKVYPEPSPIPTILISAVGHSRGWIWRDVAKKIHSIYNLSVEIIDEELEIPVRCFPIHQTDGIFHKWDNIRDTILHNLDIFDWNALECWRFGRSPNQMENPPTVVISVREDSHKNHHTDTQRIRGILAQFQEPGVSILFMNDQPVPHAPNRPLPTEACTRQLQPGVSIGIQDSTSGSSTLGGMVELRFDNGPWQKFALTCFHAVYPPDGDRASLSLIPGADEAFRLWQWRPLTFQNPMARRVLRVEQPSIQDIRHAMKNIDDGIDFYKEPSFNDVDWRLQELESGSGDAFVSEKEAKRQRHARNCIKELESARQHYECFLSQNNLGKVVSGSGLERTRRQIYAGSGNYDSIVDWALIAVAQNRSRDDNKLFRYPGLDNVMFSSARELDPKLVGRLHKTGRTTQLTTGEYGGVVQAMIARELGPHGQLQTKITYEHTVVVVDTYSASPFSEPGDSGSFVYDRGGGVIGLLLGGWERKNSTYFTPIENIFDDIKDVTGAVEVRILD